MIKKLDFTPTGLVKVDDYHIFRAETVSKKNPNGKESNFVELKSPNWVSAIVKIDDKTFVTVKQYRHGKNKVLEELPCGMVEEGEDPTTAIIRECKEEIGLTNVRKVIKLYEHSANPAFLNNNMTAYYIEGEVDEKLLSPDANEFIEVNKRLFTALDDVMSQPDTNVMMRLAWEIYKAKGL